MRIEIWSDFVCPFCYIGIRLLKRVLDEFPYRDEVEIVYRSYELYPSAATQPRVRMNEELAKEYDMTMEEINSRNAEICAMAAKAGLEMTLDEHLSVDTLDAHRLMKYAMTQNRGDVLWETLMKARFADHELIDTKEILKALADGAGLDGEAVQLLLASNDFADEVHLDQLQAEAIGVNEIPFFVFNGKYALSGVMTKHGLREAIRDVWNEEHPDRKWKIKQGMVCTSEGCFYVD